MPTRQTTLKPQYLPKGSAGGLVRWWAPFPLSFLQLCFGQININYPLNNINGDFITILDKTNWATFLKHSTNMNNKNIPLLFFSLTCTVARKNNSSCHWREINSELHRSQRAVATFTTATQYLCFGAYVANNKSMWSSRKSAICQQGALLQLKIGQKNIINIKLTRGKIAR